MEAHSQEVLLFLLSQQAKGTLGSELMVFGQIVRKGNIPHGIAFFCYFDTEYTHHGLSNEILFVRLLVDVS